MTDQKWVEEARKHIGQKEVAGVESNSWIKSIWFKLKGGAWFWTAYGEDDSKLPWCGAFAALCVQEAGIAPPKEYASAKAWLGWGVDMINPAYGCVVIFTRTGGGHVGFVVGIDAAGRLMVLGGNQGDAVSIVPFSTARVSGYRWPDGVPMPIEKSIPLLMAAGKSSVNEA
jgi:uncharacterized protein (TIGR02594 family)